MTPRFLKLFCLFIFLSLAFFGRPATLHAQNYSGITKPKPGHYLAGQVKIRGTADLDNFWKYELAYKLEPSTDDGYVFLFLAEKPVINDLLAVWDVRNLPAGEYTLRLRVVKQDGNYLELFAPGLYVNIAKPVAGYLPLPAAPPQLADQSQPPRSISLPTAKQGIAIDRVLPSPNYVRDHTLYALGEGQFLRSLDDGANWQIAAELEGAALDWSQMPVAMAQRSPSQVELLIATPSLLENPFSEAQNQKRALFASLPFAVDSPYAMQGNLLAADPASFTWQEIRTPRWFVNEPWVLSYNSLGDLWATRIGTEETFTLLTQGDLQNLVGATPFLLIKAIPSPTGDAVALVIDSQISDDPEQSVGLQLWLLSLRDANLRVVAPLQETVSPLLTGDAEAYVANRNMAVSLGSVSWAHDGRQLAFASPFGSDSSDLYRFELGSTRITRLSAEPSNIERIDWSADDSLLLYTVRHRQFDDISRSTAELYVANANGTAYRRLYNDNSRNTHIVDWTGAKSALIYSEGALEPCNLLSLRKITIAEQADVGRTESITETQVFTNSDNTTFTQVIQVPILVTTTESLVLTEILTFTTEPFQTLGYAAERQEVLLAKGDRCPGPNPKGIYRLSLNVQPLPQDPQFPQPIQLPPPQLINDQLFTTRLQPLADGRWLVQESDSALGYLRSDNQIEPIAFFTETLAGGLVVTPQLSAILDNQWLWRVENDPRSQFWISEIGALPQRVETPALRDVEASVDVSDPEVTTVVFAGINSEQTITLLRHPDGTSRKLSEARNLTALQLVKPIPPQVPLARIFSPERWTIEPLPITDLAIQQLLPSPNYALDGTLYLVGDRSIVRTTDRGRSWARLASQEIDGVPQIWAKATVSASNALLHRLVLATKRGAIVQLEPARQPWQPLLPIPDWVRTQSWVLVSGSNSLWALRNDSGELVKLATVEGTVVVDPNPQDTVPPPAPFSPPLRSPDGKWLAFRADVGFSISPSPVPVLYLLSLESGVLRAIAPLRLPYNAATFSGPDDVRTVLENEGMVWSSDSRKLAFLREQVISGTDLFVFDVASSTTTRLSDEVGNAYQLRWSPDNRYIAFTSAYSFGSGDSYAMSGAWVADLKVGKSHSLYDLPPATTAEEILGWMTAETVLVNSRHPLCGALFLRAINVRNETVTPLIPGTISRAEFSLERQAALSMATPINQQCLSLFLALTNPGAQPTNEASAIVATLLQSSVITPGIYHSYLPAQGAVPADAWVTERVGGDLVGIDDGQAAGEFESLKASLLADPQALPADALVNQAPTQVPGWSAANFFDNGFNATVQLGDALGQQLSFQIDGAKQFLATQDGLNAFLLTGNGAMRLQRIRYPLTQIDSTEVVTAPLGLSLVRMQEGEPVTVVTPSLVVARQISLPLLNGSLAGLAVAASATDQPALYLASEASLWRSLDGGRNWQTAEIAVADSIQSLALVDGAPDAGETPLLAARLHISDSSTLRLIDPSTLGWREPDIDNSWLLRDSWQLLVAKDGLWALNNSGDRLALLAGVPLSVSNIITTGVEPFYQVTVAPDQRRLAWLAPLDAIQEGLPVSMTLNLLDLTAGEIQQIASVQLPNLQLLQNETLLAWATDSKSLAFASLPMVETTSEISATQTLTDSEATSEATTAESLPAVAAIGVLTNSRVVWHGMSQGFPVNLVWANEKNLGYGLLDVFNLQRPVVSIQRMEGTTGETAELYARPPESVDERIVAGWEGKLLVQSQHPSCGAYNLRLISVESGETVPIWNAGLRYTSLKDNQLLVLAALQSPECGFGVDIATLPSASLYSLQTLTPTVLSAINDPIQGVEAEYGQRVWATTVDPVQLLQINWQDNIIVTRTVVLPVAFNSFQQAEPATKGWAGWNPSRSALWVGRYGSRLNALLTPPISEVWGTEDGILVTFGNQSAQREDAGLAWLSNGASELSWVDATISVEKRLHVAQ